jgi:hypothetical protein
MNHKLEWDLEGSGYGINEVLPQRFAGGIGENHRKQNSWYLS